MNLLTLTMSTLIDRALEEVQSPTEVSKAVVLPAQLTAGVTTGLLTGYSAEITNVIEFGSELILVTGKNSDPDPTYTYRRGYYGTTDATHVVGTVGYLDPQFPRFRTMQAVIRAFPRLEALGVPVIKSTMLLPETSPYTDDTRFMLDPGESIREVIGVSQGMFDAAGWEFLDSISTSDLASGNMIRLHSTAVDTDEFTVTYRAPYRWSTYPAQPTETSTIEVPEGAEFLPSSYAAAWLCQAREVSRHDLDRVAEWTEGEPSRAGVSARMVQGMWQKFYRELDEVRRLNTIPKRRPARRRLRPRLSPL